MKITELLLTTKNRPRTKITPKFLVIHWTANESPGANARKNRNYFNRQHRIISGEYYEMYNDQKGKPVPFRFAAAHYIVDDGEIVRALPELELGYHVGAKSYVHSSARNSNTIGIEMCVNVDGDFHKMVANTVELAADICKRYGFDPTKEMIRHYDVTGKNCPRFYVEDEKAWQAFRVEVKAKMTPVVKPKPAVVAKPKFPGKAVKVGAKGVNVSQIQKVLGVKADGDFGKLTESAVKTFQKRKGLKADGIVGEKTWGAMFK